MCKFNNNNKTINTSNNKINNNKINNNKDLKNKDQEHPVLNRIKIIIQEEA